MFPKKASKTRLKEVVIAITYRCNLRCQMCGIWKSNLEKENEFLKPSDFEKLPKSISDINLTGGEPFLRDDLAEIVARIKKRLPKAKIIISTNGFLTNQIGKEAKKLYQIDPQIGLAVSLDGIGSKHDEIRGVEGSYQRAIETIKILKKIGFENLKIGFTLGDHNVDQLKRVYQLSRELGVEFSLTLVHSSDNYFNCQNKIRKKEELVQVLNWLIEKEISSWNPKQWARAFYAFGMKKFILEGKRILPDYSGKLSVFVDPFGKIFPCDISSSQIGNLEEIEKMKASKDQADCQESWMICTARWAIKKHFLRAVFWIFKEKMKNTLKKLGSKEVNN